MKRLLFVFLAFLSLSCFAQEQARATKASPPPVQVFMNYIIKLNTNDEGGYGYDIVFQGKPMVNQKLNPFTLSPKGLATKEDAFKIARWQIQQLTTGVPAAVISGQPLSPALAKQLNISPD